MKHSPKLRLAPRLLAHPLHRLLLPLTLAAAFSASAHPTDPAGGPFVATATSSATASVSSYPGELPPPEQAIAAIHQAPEVLGALATIDAEAARRSSLEAGPYEWAVRLGGVQRRVDATDSAAQRYREWSAALERPLRMPGKASLDAAIGAQGVAQAKVGHADAMHETARNLLAAWFNWLRESDTARQWQRQSESLQRQREATARRVALGDGARLELMQAEAAAAQAQAALEQARRRAAVAAAELRSRFPAITLPATPPAAAQPQPLAGDIGEWREHLLKENHELRLARAGTQQARLLANRSDAERTPDPTVGMHVGSDRGGEERVTGLTLSIPLPGGARAANAQREGALASVAAQREAATLAKVNAEISGALAAVETAYAGWQSSEDAAQRLEQAAALMARARTLGEAALGDVLLAQRQANEARLAANATRLEALEARYRLLLDTHQLWAYADEDDDD